MMRISDSYLSNIMLQSLNANSAEMGTLFQQMSTGDNITKLSDDILGSVKLVGLDAQKSVLAQYKTNSENVKSELSLYEGRVDMLENSLQRANELALWGKNGTFSVNEREAINIELKAIQDSIVNTLNTKNDEGSYLFSGTAINEAPILVDDITGVISINPAINANTRETTVADGLTVENNITLDKILTTTPNILEHLTNLMSEFSAVTPNMTTVDASLEGIHQSISDTSSVMASIGSKINNLDTNIENSEDLGLFVEQVSLGINQLDYAEASVNLNEFMNALQASQKAYVGINRLSLFNEI
ncbi:flagellar hook-associated protein FlgL [Vibrio sp.]|nr:flagellar hook-associated protein FlgL [Vibrio sp.]